MIVLLCRKVYTLIIYFESLLILYVQRIEDLIYSNYSIFYLDILNGIN